MGSGKTHSARRVNTGLVQLLLPGAETLPAGQALHDDAAPAEKEPAGQALHDDAPPGENVPATHTCCDTAPAAYVLMPQAMADVAPALEKNPAGTSVALVAPAEAT
jgi:hypothetical protein